MGFSVANLLIIAAIIVLLFGTKKLRTLGSDLGESIKGFKKAMSDEPEVKSEPKSEPKTDTQTSEVLHEETAETKKVNTDKES